MIESFAQVLMLKELYPMAFNTERLKTFHGLQDLFAVSSTELAKMVSISLDLLRNLTSSVAHSVAAQPRNGSRKISFRWNTRAFSRLAPFLEHKWKTLDHAKS